MTVQLLPGKNEQEMEFEMIREQSNARAMEKSQIKTAAIGVRSFLECLLYCIESDCN